MRGYSAERYEALFEQPNGIEGADNVLRADEPGRYRCKTIKLGADIEASTYTDVINHLAENRNVQSVHTTSA